MDSILIAKRVREMAGRPFAWGENDCAFVAGAAWEMATGYNPAASLKGEYSSRFQYLQMLIRHGGILALARKQMNHPSVQEFGGNGIGLLSEGGLHLFGVCLNGIWLVRDENGLRNATSTASVLEAWGWSKE